MEIIKLKKIAIFTGLLITPWLYAGLIRKKLIKAEKDLDNKIINNNGKN